MTAWTPPKGSIEIEPGWWEAPNGSIYSDPDEETRLEALRQQASERHDRQARFAAARIPPEVTAQFHLEELEARVCQAYTELGELFVEVEALREYKQFADDIIAGLVLEIPGAVT